MALEDSEAEDYSSESEQGSDEEGGHPTEEKQPRDDEKEEELILNQGLWGLGFVLILRLVLSLKRT